MDGLSFCCEVVPKVVEALGAAEQGGEKCQVCQQDVAGSRACRRHPKEHVEFRVSRVDKWMRPRQIDRLPTQHPNGSSVLCGQCVVRQVLVKIERCHVRQPTLRIQIPHCRDRRNLIGVLNNCRTQTEPVLHRHPEPFHEGARVQTESLLARHQRIAVMDIRDKPSALGSP